MQVLLDVVIYNSMISKWNCFSVFLLTLTHLAYMPLVVIVLELISHIFSFRVQLFKSFISLLHILKSLNIAVFLNELNYDEPVDSIKWYLIVMSLHLYLRC